MKGNSLPNNVCSNKICSEQDTLVIFSIFIKCQLFRRDFLQVTVMT